MALAIQTAVDIHSNNWPDHKAAPRPCFGGSLASIVQHHMCFASKSDTPLILAPRPLDYTRIMQSTSVSSVGPFRVFSYFPSEGPPGTSLAVNLELLTKRNDPLFLRLVVGQRALSTSVRRLPDSQGGGWQVVSTTPADLNIKSASKVLLTVQALDSNNDVVNSFTFGQFTYVPRERAPDSTNAVVGSSNTETALATRRSDTSKPAAPRSRSLRVGQSTSGVLRTSDERSPRRQQLVRQKNRPPPGRKLCLGGDDNHSQRAQLDLLVPLDGIPKDWDEDERKCGRRLVRFTRVQDGATIQISCDRIKQQDYSEEEVVISCIYRKEANRYYVTSVDIIYLLEHIVQEEFDIEEKNRIRRNLEGFRPKTISRNRADSNDFFTLIMDFPSPKPRNIEKDVKVFDWNILAQALDKIVSRYALCVPTSEEEVSLTPDIPSPPLQSTSRLSPFSDFADRRHSGSHFDGSPEIRAPDVSWEPYDAPLFNNGYDPRPGPSRGGILSAAPTPSFLSNAFSSAYPARTPFNQCGDGTYTPDTLDTQGGLYNALAFSSEIPLLQNSYVPQGSSIHPATALGGFDFQAARDRDNLHLESFM